MTLPTIDLALHAPDLIKIAVVVASDTGERADGGLELRALPLRAGDARSARSQNTTFFLRGRALDCRDLPPIDLVHLIKSMRELEVRLGRTEARIALVFAIARN